MQAGHRHRHKTHALLRRVDGSAPSEGIGGFDVSIPRSVRFISKKVKLMGIEMFSGRQKKCGEKSSHGLTEGGDARVPLQKPRHLEFAEVSRKPCVHEHVLYGNSCRLHRHTDTYSYCCCKPSGEGRGVHYSRENQRHYFRRTTNYRTTHGERWPEKQVEGVSRITHLNNKQTRRGTQTILTRSHVASEPPQTSQRGQKT